MKLLIFGLAVIIVGALIQKWAEKVYDKKLDKIPYKSIATIQSELPSTACQNCLQIRPEYSYIFNTYCLENRPNDQYYPAYRDYPENYASHQRYDYHFYIKCQACGKQIYQKDISRKEILQQSYESELGYCGVDDENTVNIVPREKWEMVMSSVLTSNENNETRAGCSGTILEFLSDEWRFGLLYAIIGVPCFMIGLLIVIKGF